MGIDLKILIAADCYKPIVNGVVTSVVNLKTSLEKMGHSVKILTLSDSCASYESDNVIYIGSVGIGFIYPDARLTSSLFHSYIKRLINWHPDIIHTQSEFSTFLLAKKIAEATDTPIIHTYHTVYEDYTHYFCPSVRVGKKIAKVLTKKVLSNAAMVIAPTKKVKELLYGYGIKIPVTTVPTGLIIDEFEKEISKNELIELRKRTGISENDRVFLYAGRLAKEKNIEELFLLMQKCKSDNIKLLLVGDGPYRGELEKKSRMLGISNKIIFAGCVSPDNISRYYKMADVFVSASQSETQGLTYIEAMASGLPVISKKDECLLGVINDGKNGFLYETEDEFWKKADDIFTDADMIKSIRNNEIETVKSYYSCERFALNLLNAYEAVMAGNVYE